MGKGTEKTVRKTVGTRPGRNGGTLRSGNPGNKGGGRHKAYAIQRAEELSADPVVWDQLHTQAKQGDIKTVSYASELAWGKPKEQKELSGTVTIKHAYDE